MMNWKNLAIIPVAALALQGCGGDPDALSSASGQVTAAQSTAVIGTVNTTIGNINLSLTAPGGTNAPVGGGPAAASIYDGCTTVGPDPRVDADGDGIALSKVYTFNCSNIMDSGNLYNLIGAESFTDKDDTKSIQLGGYGRAYDYVFSYKTGARTNINTRNGSFDLTPSTTAFAVSHVYTDDINDTGGTNEAVYKLRTNWSATYSPTDMANPSNGGAVAISGFFGLSGFNNYPNGWTGVDVVWEVSSSDLTYQNGCLYYKSGTVAYTDGSGNRFTWEYNCNDAIIRFNGSQIGTLPI